MKRVQFFPFTFKANSRSAANRCRKIPPAQTSATTANELRSLIANNIQTHPSANFWRSILFIDNDMLMKSFIKKHSRSGTFTDSEVGFPLLL
jgi:hypothetical protein